MAVQDTLVVAQQGQNVGQGVIVCDQREVVVKMSSKIVDLEMVVGLGGLWQWRGRRVHVMRRAAFALEVGRPWRRVVLRMLRGHGEVGRRVRLEGGHVVRGLVWPGQTVSGGSGRQRRRVEVGGDGGRR